MSPATASGRIRNPSKPASSMRSADVLDHCALVALWLLAEVNTGFGLILTISTYAQDLPPRMRLDGSSFNSRHEEVWLVWIAQSRLGREQALSFVNYV